MKKPEASSELQTEFEKVNFVSMIKLRKLERAIKEREIIRGKIVF